MTPALPLLQSRDRVHFAGPSGTANEVVREHLDHHYTDATGSILRVLAPAGYGKSTIVARWARHESRPTVWLDLEQIDNDPIVLLNTLAGGLTACVDATFDVLSNEIRRDATDNVRVPTLGQLVSECATPFVMVLDDIHILVDPMAADVVDTVASNLPSHSTLVLVGRSHHHDAAIAQLRLRPGVVDLRSDDLAFGVAEATEMVSTMGVELGPDTIATMIDEFEGWPAGLRLAALTFRSHGPEANDPSGAGPSRYVTEYLAVAWLGDLDTADRQLMQEAACLGRFSGPACDAALGRSGSAADLRRIRRELLALIPLDERDEEFRFHSLLGDWLSRELRDRAPARYREIHRAASTYWEEHGDVDLAVEHAVRADDLDRCAALIVAHGGTYQAWGLAPTVSRWLSNLPDLDIRASGPLCALASTSAMHRGDGADSLRWSRLLASSRRDGDGQLDARADVLYATLEPRPVADTMPVARRALREIEPGGPWRALACWTFGGNAFLAGLVDQCLERLEEGVYEAELMGAQIMRTNCLAHLAAIEDLRGNSARANELGGRAATALGNYGADHLPTTAGVAAITALTEARAGRRHIALASIETSRRYLEGFTRVAPWYNVLSRIALVRASLACDQAAAAREILRELQGFLGVANASAELDVLFDPLRCDVETASKLLADRTWSLTEAELRIMQYLPTNLTLADIATRLFVSRNTVKSHAAAIYRKLGTTSRSEAVEIARDAGLLTDLGGDQPGA